MRSLHDDDIGPKSQLQLDRWGGHESFGCRGSMACVDGEVKREARACEPETRTRECTGLRLPLPRD